MLQGEAVKKGIHPPEWDLLMGTPLKTSKLHREFGARVQELRLSRGLTQEDLAEAVGVDRSYMGFIERGEKNATLDKIGKIAAALHVSLFELFKF